jgi:hypothetical protein
MCDRMGRHSYILRFFLELNPIRRKDFAENILSHKWLYGILMIDWIYWNIIDRNRK